MKWLGAVSAIALFCFAGAQAPEQRLRLSIGERAPITLEENPSTGYAWRIDSGKSSNLSILHIEDGGFSRPESRADLPLVGAPGVHHWTVRAVSRGRARIEFVYQRPWEKTPARHQVVSIEAR